MTATTSPEEDSHGHLNYFAIGSMLNPQSAKHRGIQFSFANPGKLANHKIHWFGHAGFAEAVAEEGTVLHGVIYQVSPKEMEKLDKIERGYIRKTARASYYNGTELEVTVYCRPESEQRGSHIDMPPTQRYLEIIIEGARHYGLDTSYIEMLEQTKYQPRPKPCDFKSLGEATEDMPLVKLNQVQECNGQNDKPLYITSNGKVLELVREQHDELYKESVWFHQGGNRHVEFAISRLLYDPKYGAPETLGQFTREHCAYTEHILCDFLEKENRRNDWKIVARFDQSYQE